MGRRQPRKRLKENKNEDEDVRRNAGRVQAGDRHSKAGKVCPDVCGRPHTARPLPAPEAPTRGTAMPPTTSKPIKLATPDTSAPTSPASAPSPRGADRQGLRQLEQLGAVPCALSQPDAAAQPQGPRAAPPAPVTAAPKIAIGAPKPIIAVPKIAIGAPKNAILGPKPVIGGPKPVIAAPRLLVAAPRPVIGGPGPLVAAPKLAIGGPRPVIGAPKLAMGVPKPIITPPNGTPAVGALKPIGAPTPFIAAPKATYASAVRLVPVGSLRPMSAAAWAEAAQSRRLGVAVVAAGMVMCSNTNVPRTEGLARAVRVTTTVQQNDERTVQRGTTVEDGEVVEVALKSVGPFKVRVGAAVQLLQQQQGQGQQDQLVLLTPDVLLAADRALRHPDAEALWEGLAGQRRVQDAVDSASSSASSSSGSSTAPVQAYFKWDVTEVPRPANEAPEEGCRWYTAVTVSRWAAGGCLSDALVRLVQDAVRGQRRGWAQAFELMLISLDALKTWRGSRSVLSDLKLENMVVELLQDGVVRVLAIDLDGAHVLDREEAEAVRALAAGQHVGQGQQQQQQADRAVGLMPVELEAVTLSYSAPEQVVGLYHKKLHDLHHACPSDGQWKAAMRKLRGRPGVWRLAQLVRSGQLSSCKSLFACGGWGYTCLDSHVFLWAAGVKAAVEAVLRWHAKEGMPLREQDRAAVRGLAGLMDRCMATLPEQRPSLEEVEEALRGLVEQQERMEGAQQQQQAA